MALIGLHRKVVDDNINVRDLKDVIWAITTCMDATHKWPGETNREWGRTMAMTPEVTAKMEQVWQSLGF